MKIGSVCIWETERFATLADNVSDDRRVIAGCEEVLHCVSRARQIGYGIEAYLELRLGVVGAHRAQPIKQRRGRNPRNASATVEPQLGNNQSTHNSNCTSSGICIGCGRQRGDVVGSLTSCCRPAGKAADEQRARVYDDSADLLVLSHLI